MSQNDTRVRGDNFKQAFEVLKSKEFGGKLKNTIAAPTYRALKQSVNDLNKLTDDLYKKDKFGNCKLLIDTDKADETNLAKLKRAYRLTGELAKNFRLCLSQEQNELGDVFYYGIISVLGIFEQDIEHDNSVINSYVSDEKLSLPELMYRSNEKTHNISEEINVLGGEKKSSPISETLKNEPNTNEKPEERLQDTLKMLVEYKDKLKKATGIRGSSKNYKDMQKELNNSIELIEGTLSNKGNTKKNISQEDYSLCMKSLNKVYAAADWYAANKEREKNRSNYANKRLGLAKEFMSVLSDTIAPKKVKQNVEHGEKKAIKEEISLKSLESTVKTEEALKTYGKYTSAAEKANFILTGLPKLSSQAYADFNGKISDLLKHEKLKPQIVGRIAVAKVISDICKKGKEAESILLLNKEEQKGKLGNIKTFKNIDECKLAFAKMKLVDNAFRMEGGTQGVFERYISQYKINGIKGRQFGEVVNEAVKNSSFYKNLKSVDEKETQEIIKSGKNFASLSADMDAALNKDGKITKQKEPAKLTKKGREKY